MLDRDFNKRIQGYSLVTVNVLYYMPDHRSLLQEFIWQTLDIRPRYPRVEAFLDHWRREIEAVIKEVTIAHDDIVKPVEWRTVSGTFTLN